jgi:mono/diheme cytochrome c family protein
VSSGHRVQGADELKILMEKTTNHSFIGISLTKFSVVGWKPLARLRVATLCALSLSACGPTSDSTVDTTPLTGRDIYLMRCTACHQVDGGGIPGNCPPFQGSPRLSGSSEELIRLLLLGQRGPLQRDGRIYKGIMPSWRSDLTDEQAAEVLNYILTTWSALDRKVSAEEVAKVRAETANSKLLPETK